MGMNGSDESSQMKAQLLEQGFDPKDIEKALAEGKTYDLVEIVQRIESIKDRERHKTMKERQARIKEQQEKQLKEQKEALEEQEIQKKKDAVYLESLRNLIKGDKEEQKKNSDIKKTVKVKEEVKHDYKIKLRNLDEGTTNIIYLKKGNTIRELFDMIRKDANSNRVKVYEMSREELMESDLTLEAKGFKALVNLIIQKY